AHFKDLALGRWKFGEFKSQHFQPWIFAIFGGRDIPFERYRGKLIPCRLACHIAGDAEKVGFRRTSPEHVFGVPKNFAKSVLKEIFLSHATQMPARKEPHQRGRVGLEELFNYE
ncbi:hypothetical protein N8615_03120, partial [Verrucomicrobiales bacterium]|nr:hypothetical protein [Verrucomicrobiales bacterium]